MGMKPRPPGPIPPFAPIYQRAVKRKGGAAALEELLPAVRTAGDVARTADDRFLSEMAKCIFRAGFVWRVVDNKWPGFEEAFHRFDIRRVATMDEGAIDDLAADARVIRNRPKLVAVRDNARFIADVASEHGSFGRWLADWPPSELVTLWKVLADRGSRLGGMTGPMFLRGAGVDTFLLSGDVVRALIENGVVDRPPTSQRARTAVQAAFNAWRAETGRPMCQLSRILSCSTGDNYL
jgi:3-methyladenine DNA glycosylase Tag